MEKKLSKPGTGDGQADRSLVEHVKACAIYMLTPEGVIKSWYEGENNIYGFNEREVIGTHFSRFYCEKERTDGLPMNALKLAAGRGHGEMFGKRLRRDGACLQSYSLICPVPSQSGAVLGFGKVTCVVSPERKIRQILSLTKEVARLFEKAWGSVPDHSRR